MSTFFTFLACIIWMVPAVSSSPTGHMTDDAVTKNISVLASSPAYLSKTELCQDMKNKRYDIYYKSDGIASCDGGRCEGQKQFKNRVAFIQENCTFVVQDMTIADAGVYTLLTWTDEDHKLKSHQTFFHITIKENVSVPPATHVPLLNELTGNRTANVPEGISVCFSMAPLGNALCCVLHRFLCWLANKNKNGKKVPSLSRASNFIQGDRFQIGVKKGLCLGGIISVICQFVSIVWSFLPEYKYNPVVLIIAIVCLVIPTVDLAFKCSECKYLRIVWKYWFYISVITQAAFTACIVIHFHITYGAIDRRMASYLFIAFMISLGVHLVCLLACFYCSPTKNNEEKKPEETHMMETHHPNSGESSSTNQTFGRLWRQMLHLCKP
ncbi:uncharacterized protein LOC143975616 [Lithobates pipiens]